MTFARESIESALDSGRLMAEMANGRWWRLRRNGATKTWKLEPMRFRIPVKAGLRAHGYITESNMNSGNFKLED